MFSRLLGWTRRATQAVKSGAPAVTRSRPKLGCEMLEARDVPAVYYWDPVLDQNGGEEQIDPRVSVGSNWTDQYGTRYSDSSPPGANDDLYYIGTSLEPSNGAPQFPWSESYIDSSSGGTFKSIHLLAGYTGTVHLQVATTVGTFEQQDGAIAQESGGLDFYVTSSFTFTGGTLNNTSSLGTVHLQGATGTIQPATNGSVERGSTLSLESRSGVGSTLTQLPGTEWTTNGAGMDVFANCSYELPEQPGAGPVKVLKKQGRVEKDGVINLYIDGTENVNQVYETDAGIWVQGGILTITHDAKVTGTVAPGNTTNVGLTLGAVYLKNGTTLTTPIFAMNGGVFYTTPAAAGVPQVATIDGTIAVTNGSIILGQVNGQPHTWSELKATQQFNMSGGLFAASVDGTNGSASCDKITALKTMRFFGTAKVAASVVNPPQGGVSTRSWIVFEATDGFTETTLATDPGWDTYTNMPARKIFLRKD